MEQKRMMGLITYHSAYNYGSVYQAYATQRYLLQHFPRCELKTINYRLNKQKEYYALIRLHFGKMALIKDLLQLPIYNKRKKRSTRFEQFINSKFTLTEEYAEPEQVYSQWDEYDVIISGSDQIWNKHSCELHTNEWKYIFPYVLHGFGGQKISYASSIGGMSDEEMEQIIQDIALFDSVSMREQASTLYLENKLGRKVQNVLDPTFLIRKEEWISDFNLKDKEAKKYILYYSLNRDYLSAIRNLKKVSEFAKRKELFVKVITPYTYLYDFVYKNVSNCCDAGPMEFLDLMYNASLVITDSYHGTALSINLNKDFLAIGINKIDTRIIELLSKLELTERFIETIEMLDSIQLTDIQYDRINQLLEDHRKTSSEYLQTSVTCI